jgi:purine-binding chemotaxis protein CheW
VSAEKSENKQVGDKDELHLTETEAWLETAEEIGLEVLEQAWALRAAQLAQSANQAETGKQVEAVVVQLGREQYGLEVPCVYEIRPMQTLTRVPRVPAWVSGVVNLRGRIMSVVDLGLYLGLPATKRGENSISQLVVVETPEMELALKVDDVLGVEPIPVSKIQEITGSVNGIRMEYVRGLVVRETTGSGMLTLLDVSSLLADARLIVHDEIV